MSPQMSCDFVTLWLCISLIWSNISIPETVSQQQHSRGERQSPRTWMVWDDNKQCHATWSHHCKYCWGVPSTTHDYHWCPPQHCQAEGSSDDLWRQNQFHQWVTHVLPVLDQGWRSKFGGVEFVGAIFLFDPVQNHPLMIAGCRSSLSHPLKSQSLPEVQM